MDKEQKSKRENAAEQEEKKHLRKEGLSVIAFIGLLFFILWLVVDLLNYGW